MKTSTWVLLVVLLLLVGYWPWLYLAPLAALVFAAHQPFILAAIAVCLIVVKFRRRHA